MSRVVYGVSWLEWAGSSFQGREAPKRRRSKFFATEEEREKFMQEEKLKDDFLYELGHWQEVLL